MNYQTNSTPNAFFLVTLHSSKKNADLLDSSGNLRSDIRRNIDYTIVQEEAWNQCKTEYDKEIKVNDIYEVFISFSCNGVSFKNLYVHGVEKVFDVIQTLFVNKTFGIDYFEEMFEIKSNSKTVDPNVNFEYFGDNSQRVVLSVERKRKLKDDSGTIMESSVANDIESQIGSVFSNSQFPQDSNNSFHDYVEDMKFYQNIYTNKDNNETMFSRSASVNETDTIMNEDDHGVVYEHSNRSLSCPNLDSADLNCTQQPYKLYSKLRDTKCIGIPNIGNSCYMNSSIQCLSNCNMFSNFFVMYGSILRSESAQSNNEYYPFLELFQSKEYPKNRQLIAACAQLMTDLKINNEVSPRGFKAEFGKKNSSFNNSREQDAAEFIEALLTYLHEGLSYNKESLTKFLTSSDRKSADDKNITKLRQKLNLNDSNERSFEWHGAVLNRDNESKNSQEPLNSKSSKSSSALNTKYSIEKEFQSLIDKERSIISELFYGMFTNIFECQNCHFKKFKNDLMMFLPLPIPNRINYHCSSVLVLSDYSVPKKVLIPLSYRIQEAIDYTRVEYDVPHSILAVEYDNNYPVAVLPLSKAVSAIKNKIVFYEYNPNLKYAICHLFYTKFLFLKKKISTDFLIEINDVTRKLYEKLKPFFIKDFTLNQFLKAVEIKKEANNPILNIPTFTVVVKDVNMLFENNIFALSPHFADKKDDISLSDCLSYYFKEEEVDLNCEVCKKNTKYKMKSELTKLPKYLIIHFKRFSYLGNNAKINTFIDFPENCLKLFNGKYKLISTANHIEIGMGYGHYMAFVKKQDGWYCCNDSVISRTVGPDKSTAYILFYELIE